MRYILFIIGVALLSSCGPAGKLRRAERLIAKAEAQGAVWSIDTVYKEVPVYVPEVQVDTLVTNVSDTIVLTKERLTTKVKVDFRDRTVYVNSVCKADTVYKRVVQTVEKRIEVKEGIPWWKVALWLLAACSIGFFLGRITR
jgi:hypothetical protein